MGRHGSLGLPPLSEGAARPCIVLCVECYPVSFDILDKSHNAKWPGLPSGYRSLDACRAWAARLQGPRPPGGHGHDVAPRVGVPCCACVSMDVVAPSASVCLRVYDRCRDLCRQYCLERAGRLLLLAEAFPMARGTCRHIQCHRRSQRRVGCIAAMDVCRSRLAAHSICGFPSRASWIHTSFILPFATRASRLHTCRTHELPGA